MKNQLLKKLYAFIILSMYSLGIVKAQIVYTDVIPDDTISCGNPCTEIDSLDLNNDGNIDFVLSNYFQSLGSCGQMTPPRYKSGATVSSIGANSFYGLTSNYPAALDYGYRIDNNFIWSNNIKTLCEVANNMTTCFPSTIHTGNWNTDTVYYLPVKIVRQGNNYFGWIKMKIFPIGFYNHIGLILESYAYNGIPNQFILAGDTSVTSKLSLSAVINSPLCFGSNINIDYTIAGIYDSTNVFTAELSDSNGSFSNPFVIGSINSNQSGFIAATIPQNVSDGNAYRIRVTSSLPALNSFDNGNNLIIYSAHPPVSLNNFNPDTICIYDPDPLHLINVQVSASLQNLFHYQWLLNGVEIPSETSRSCHFLSQTGVDTFQTFICTVIVSDVCASDTSLPITKTLFPTIVTLDSFPDACLNDPPLILNGGSPPGGYYTVAVNGGNPGTISLGGVLNYANYGAGNYAIYYFTPAADTFGCTYGRSITQYFNVNICTGIKDNIISANFSVFVTDQKIYVQIGKNVLAYGNISIYNLIGQEIKKVKISGNLTEIEMDKNKDGIYFITVQTNGAIETSKIYLN